MSWTYNSALLTSTATAGTLMRIRLVLGDTNASAPLFQDEEIYYVASGRDAVNFIAADLADALAARYAGQINTENSELRVSAAARHKQYFALADRLRKNGPGNFAGGSSDGAILGTGTVTGQSKTANETLLSDTDVVVSDLYIGMDDYEPGESNSDYFK